MKMKSALSIDQKLKILESLKENTSVKEICARYNVHKSTITRIKKDQEKIREFAKKTVIPTTKVKRIASVSIQETEKALYMWFLSERIKHNLVTDKILQLKALEFHNELNPSKKFEASHGWVQKFKKRHSIRLLKVCGEKLSCNDNAVPLFVERFIKLLHDKDLLPDQIYNADESGLVYKFLNNTTLVSSNERYAPGRKASKERITIMPCTNANGQHKLPLMIVGKSKKPRSFKNVILPELHYRASKNAWQTRELFKEWFYDVFIPQVKKYLIGKNLPPKAVLLLDNATAHCDEVQLISDDGNISVFFFPPNTTAILQPLDQHVIKTLKQVYRKKLLFDLISKTGDNLNDKLNEINLKDVVFLITEAWNEVSETVISRGFQQLFTPNISETISSNFKSPSSYQNEKNEIFLTKLYRIVVPTTNLKDEDIIEWASGVGEISGTLITEDDIIEEIQNNKTDEYEDNAETNINEVVNCLNITIDYAESNFSIEEILFLRKLREKVIASTIEKIG